MTNPFGGFTAEALEAYQKVLAEQAGTDFAEGDSYDFTTCIRPDGSAYGTGGKCRKGTEGEAKSKEGGKGEFSSFDKLSQDQRDRRIKQQAELVRDLKKDGNADWKSERGRLDRMLDKDKEVAAKKPEQSTADKAMEMVMANARARGLTEIKRGESKAAAPSVPASTAKKPYPQSYDWRNQSGTFRKSAND
jgi:hypothetical protein